LTGRQQAAWPQSGSRLHAVQGAAKSFVCHFVETEIRNEAETKRKAQTLADRDEDSKNKGYSGLTVLQKAIQRLTQRTVKFIRWLKNHLDTKRSWTQTLARLAKIYATS
jgi:hypothetical protein